jgi:hypothetical protein
MSVCMPLWRLVRCERRDRWRGAAALEIAKNAYRLQPTIVQIMIRCQRPQRHSREPYLQIMAPASLTILVNNAKRLDKML